MVQEAVRAFSFEGGVGFEIIHIFGSAEEEEVGV
jgi:hypothetical protein